MNLDGETNLKERSIPIDNLDDRNLQRFSGCVVCEKPSESLEAWDGNLHSPLLK
jgi:hypothetical protein